MKKTKLTFIESLLCARYSKINFKIVLLNPENIKDEMICRKSNQIVQDYTGSKRWGQDWNLSIHL